MADADAVGAWSVRRRTWIYAVTASGSGVLVLLLVALVGFQDNLFRHIMDPRAPFQTMTPPPAPDYSRNASWAARPDRRTPGEPAIFFVHPTTYWGGDAWNAAIDHPIAARRLDESAAPTYAGAFAPLGALWAPRYRQASLYSSLTLRFDARLARALAYSDVRRAFATFLAEAPPESPLVLVGVEQGGLHVLGLLQDVLVSEPLRSRLAVAYVIDQAVPLDLFNGALSHLKPCRTPADTGCIVSWGAIEAGRANTIDDFRRRSMVWMDNGRLEPTDGRALLCVNPILGAAGEDFTPRRTHEGAVDASGLALGVEPAPLAAQTSAQCSDGVLLIDRPVSPSMRDRWRWGGRFKPRTPFLFYVDARQDAARRLGVALEALAAPPAAEASNREGLLPPLEAIEVAPSPINRVPD
jgi:hypothetical protein